MRQGFISAFCLSAFLSLTAVVPALAEDAKVDIMNPYVGEQKAVVDRTIATNKAYDDRWYEYVGERYGTSIPRQGSEDTKKADEESAEANIKAARKVFKEYRGYLADADPEVLGLFDSSAKVVVTFVHQGGQKRDQTFTMSKYETKVAQDMTIQKTKHETPVFTNVKYTPVGSAVRITAVVTYPVYHHTTPLMLIVKPDLDRKDSGEWEIVEERYLQQM